MRKQGPLLLDHPVVISQLPNLCTALHEYIIWVRSFTKMLPTVKFAEDKVLIFVILRKKC